jgi:hypothetical protein
MRIVAFFTSLCALSASVCAFQGAPQSPTSPHASTSLATTTQPAIVLGTSSGIADMTRGGSAYAYCPATANSQGSIAFVGYVGSLDLQQGTFALFCTGVPIHAETFGMFTYGPNQARVPFGNGYLCVDPVSRMPVVRLTTYTVFLTLQSTPREFAPFVPGSSWNFQFWYRDAAGGGAGFNLSRALHIDFAP